VADQHKGRGKGLGVCLGGKVVRCEGRDGGGGPGLFYGGGKKPSFELKGSPGGVGGETGKGQGDRKNGARVAGKEGVGGSGVRKVVRGVTMGGGGAGGKGWGRRDTERGGGDKEGKRGRPI